MVLGMCNAVPHNDLEGADTRAFSAFLPWHRLFIHLQEKLLQDECGYTGGVPYWDEQRDLELFETIDKASVWGSNDLSFGTNGTGADGCVTDGAFANTTLHIDQASRSYSI
jgi:tyrosinase